LIDQRLILNDSPYEMHNVEIPSQFEFQEHDKSRFDHDNPIFNNYFVVPKLNARINVSSNDPIQYEIFDCNAHILTT
jgi:hypothetical protein